MLARGQSTIAQLLYPDELALDFARIVAELEQVLTRLRGQAVSITWDCDDLVVFDMPETRILLAWTELASPGIDGCLTVSVGPNPDAGLPCIEPEHDILCSRLVERLQLRFAPAAVIWNQVDGAIGSETVDDLIDTLPDLAAHLPPVDSIIEALSHRDLCKSQEPIRHWTKGRPRVVPTVHDAPPIAPRVPPGPVQSAANDRPDLPLPCTAELARLRQALYPGDSPQHSPQMRLAAHCFNATLILIWSPLGAAVMTYSVLKGADVRLSSRLMAVSGTLFALAHSPVGQSVAAMAGVLKP